MLVNFTPDTLHVECREKKTVAIEPCGYVPRVEQTRQALALPDTAHEGHQVPVSETTFGELGEDNAMDAPLTPEEAEKLTSQALSADLLASLAMIAAPPPAWPVVAPPLKLEQAMALLSAWCLEDKRRWFEGHREDKTTCAVDLRAPVPPGSNERTQTYSGEGSSWANAIDAAFADWDARK